ncbi:hypothetical protein GCM10027297_06560 [Parahaliea aestuarii]
MSFDNVAITTGPGYESLKLLPGSAERKTRTSQKVTVEAEHFGRSMDIIGDRWSFLIISAAYFGVARFDEFQAQLNISSNILSDRLANLSNHGMLARNRYSERPPRYEYILTQKSLDFYQIPLMLALWGDRWLTVPEGELFVRHHIPCGHRLKVVAICAECSEPVSAASMSFA